MRTRKEIFLMKCSTVRDGCILFPCDKHDSAGIKITHSYLDTLSNTAIIVSTLSNTDNKLQKYDTEGNINISPCITFKCHPECNIFKWVGFVKGFKHCCSGFGKRSVSIIKLFPFNIAKAGSLISFSCKYLQLIAFCLNNPEY